jgi:hypothetical protein
MESKPAPDWWARNWKWLVPAGCLTAVVGVTGFLALIVSLVFGLLRSSTPYRQALARVQNDPVVISQLGRPISGGFFVSGSVQLNGAEGQASLAIPLEGPKGSGTLSVEARRSAGTWTTSTLTLQPNGAGGAINLLRPAI